MSLLEIVEKRSAILGHLVLAVVVLWTKPGVEQKYVYRSAPDITTEGLWQEAKMKPLIAGSAEVGSLAGLPPTSISNDALWALLRSQYVKVLVEHERR